MATTRFDRWLIRSAVLLIAVAITLILFISCAQSPTAPTPAPTAAAALSPYRWDIVAPGCAPAAPLPALTEVPPTRELMDRTVTPPRLTLFYQQCENHKMNESCAKPNGDEDFIVGQFNQLDKVWAVCSWALLTRGVDR